MMTTYHTLSETKTITKMTYVLHFLSFSVIHSYSYHRYFASYAPWNLLGQIIETDCSLAFVVSL